MYSGVFLAVKSTHGKIRNFNTEQTVDVVVGFSLLRQRWLTFAQLCSVCGLVLSL